MPSLSTKIERVSDIIAAVARLESMAMSAQVPSVTQALNRAKNTAGYALAMLKAEQERTPARSQESPG